MKNPENSRQGYEKHFIPKSKKWKWWFKRKAQPPKDLRMKMCTWMHQGTFQRNFKWDGGNSSSGWYSSARYLRGGTVTSSTSAPFSDKLMMITTFFFCNVSLGTQSFGANFSMRNDLNASLWIMAGWRSRREWMFEQLNQILFLSCSLDFVSEQKVQQ